jgi:hypothetical protein
MPYYHRMVRAGLDMFGCRYGLSFREIWGHIKDDLLTSRSVTGKMLSLEHRDRACVAPQMNRARRGPLSAHNDPRNALCTEVDFRARGVSNRGPWEE